MFDHRIDRQSEIAKRIPPSEASAIDKELQKLSHIPETIEALVTANKQGKRALWLDEPAIHAPSMPYYALLAYQQGLLEKYPFTTLMLYWAAAQQHGKGAVAVHFLFEEDNAESQEILMKSLQTSDHDEPSHFTLDNEEFEEFLTELIKKPVSEHRFFIVPRPSKTIIDELERLDFSILGTVDNDMYMIPSIGIIQSFLKVKCMYPVDIDTMMSLETLQGIRDSGLVNKRPFAFHFPHVFLPDEADGFKAPWYVFSKHDFYHLAIVSIIPLLHRKIFTEIADALQDILMAKLQPFLETVSFLPEKISSLITEYYHEPYTQLMEYMVAIIIDMEHTNYQGNSALNLENKFWLGMVAVLIAAKSKLYVLYGHTDIIADVNFTSIFTKIFEVISKFPPKFNIIPASGFSNLLNVIQIHSNSLDFFSQAMTTTYVNELEIIKNAWIKADFIKNVDAFILEQVKTSFSDKSEAGIFAQLDFIEYKIKPYFSNDNVIAAFNRACDAKLRKLQQACMIFMSENLVTLMDESTFIDLQVSHPKRFNPFIKQALASRYCESLILDILKLSKEKLISGLQIVLLANPVDHLYPNGFTLLDYAVKSRNIEAVEFVLKKGANPNPQCGSKAIPSIFSAIYHASGQIFRLLRTHGFNMNLTYEGKTVSEYFTIQSLDPNTYTGVIRKDNVAMRKGGSFSFSHDNKITLFYAANKTCSQIKKPEALARKTSAEELEYELIEQQIDWACSRLSY